MTLKDDLFSQVDPTTIDLMVYYYLPFVLKWKYIGQVNLNNKLDKNNAYAPIHY